MKLLGSTLPLSLMLLMATAVGCTKDEPPPTPDTSVTAKALASARNKLNLKNPVSPVASRMDPQVMKDYRLDVCYYGTLSLREARDAYLASLGKDEPSEKKIPAFGLPPPPPTPGAPAASGSAKAPPAPSAAPSGAGSAGPVRPPRHETWMRAPHERNARACMAAVQLKEPAMAPVDTALNGFAQFAVDLAKDITSASQYYQREEYKKDNFVRGKELDKKLREAFGKLDGLQEALGTALTQWRKDHPLDPSKMVDGEKPARDAIDDARELYVMVAFKKAEAEPYKAAVEKLDKSVTALKGYAEGHQTDPWAKIMPAPFEAMLKTVKDAKLTADKTYEPEVFLNFVGNFTGLIEARQRAISRVTMARPVPVVPPPGIGSGAPAPAPTPSAQ